MRKLSSSVALFGALTFLVLRTVSSGVCQQVARAATGEIQIVQLAWKPEEKGPQIASLAYVLPVQCGGGGPIVRMVPLQTAGGLPNLNTLVLLAGDSGLTRLDVAKANDVKTPEVRSYFGTDSDVVVLLTGADELRIEKQHFRTIPPPGSSQTSHEIEQTVNRAEQHRYILHFDFTGDLRKVYKLDDPFEYSVVAEFASGNLLLGGMPMHGKPRWAIADGDGTIRGYITLPNETKLREDAAALFDPNGHGPSSAESMFGMTQIVPYRDQLVMIPPGKSGVLYVIGENGVARTLRLHLPAGLEPGSAIASTSNLLLRANDPTKVKNGLETGPIYNINMETGAPLLQYETGDVKPSSVLCSSGSDFIALHSDKLWLGAPQ